MITSKDYRGDVQVLIRTTTNQCVARGDQARTSKGSLVTISGGRAPHKPSSTGKVWVTHFGGHMAEYYPRVVGCKWADPKEVI